MHLKIPFEFTVFRDRLRRALSSSEKSTLVIQGCQSLVPLAENLSSQSLDVSKAQTHVVLFPDDESLFDFEENLSSFSPKISIHCLTSLDVSPFSGLHYNPYSMGNRLGWLYHALHAKSGDVFLISVPALSQKTLPTEEFLDSTSSWKIGDEIGDGFFKKLLSLGYTDSPQVEDVGQFSRRGGLFDIFTPTSRSPLRVELFGDQIESIRCFDPETQKSLSTIQSFDICPCREILLTDDSRERAATALASQVPEKTELILSLLKDLSRDNYNPTFDLLLPLFYEKLVSPMDYFITPLVLWSVNPLEQTRQSDLFWRKLKEEVKTTSEPLIYPSEDALSKLYLTPDDLQKPLDHQTVVISSLTLNDPSSSSQKTLSYPCSRIEPVRSHPKDLLEKTLSRVRQWNDSGHPLFIACHSQSQIQRISLLLEKESLDYDVLSETSPVADVSHISLFQGSFNESISALDEPLILLRDEDFFGAKTKFTKTTSLSFEEKQKAFVIDDLKPGDHVVHIQHGVGLYEGLKKMLVQGIDAEFLQLKYKDNDRLYVPVYRLAQIKRYSGPSVLDKLGSGSWEKTQIKVKSHLKDVAAELLDLYARRTQMERPVFSTPKDDYFSFENSFPYQETEDQKKAIMQTLQDLQKKHPMDRLVCGDVGFGKTEVALRASFKVVEDRKQVAILVPTTILAFQHFETFKKRFEGWPIRVEGLSRFTPTSEARQIVQDLKDGKVDVLIGTHRILSKDIAFKNLGLLIIDEEQRFGVTHKEKIRKIKTGVDTLTLSATPIPRTLNLSLTGIRDISLIQTPPRERLPIRTFVMRFEAQTIRKAILSEIQRGGQVYYLHNRVDSIYSVQDELRELVPEARIRVGHGQLEEKLLEETMTAFFKKEFDVLLSTTIIESGLDIASANTMIIDRANTFGLSQLYQLRGRIGRSKERAYCYLLIPPTGLVDPTAQERLRILQEHTALGSGFKIAYHDMELRGAGNILGEDQSGFANAVGHELYLELLEQAIQQIKGSTEEPAIEPELNLRIAALIPDAYVSDIRLRLSLYRKFTQLSNEEDVDRMETELRDFYGEPPEQVLNLLGLMLIRKVCQKLFVRDLSAGTKSLSLTLTEKTPLTPQHVMSLISQSNKKYSITPESRLLIRMNEMTWPRIYDELQQLLNLVRIRA